MGGIASVIPANPIGQYVSQRSITLGANVSNYYTFNLNRTIHGDRIIGIYACFEDSTANVLINSINIQPDFGTAKVFITNRGPAIDNKIVKLIAAYYKEA